MTSEKAINMLHGIRADNLNLDDAYTKDKYEALDMAIKALEQESYNSLRTFRIDSLDSLPAVFPKIRTGKWITNGTQDSMIGEEYKCSICNKVFILDHNFNYCPNCGTKMEVDNG